MIWISLDNYRIMASLAFAFIIIVIGCPMWWQTTTVYRVPLPYAKINALNDEGINVISSIKIFTHSPKRSDLLVEELNKLNAKSGKKKLE